MSASGKPAPGSARCAKFHKAAEIVRNGLIGKITRVEVGLPAGNHDSGHTGQFMSPTASAAGAGLQHLDRPFQNDALYPRPDSQELALELQHRRRPIDGLGRASLRHRALGLVASTTPVRSRSKARASFRRADAVWNTATKYRIELKYPGDIAMTIAGGYKEIRSGTKWIGTDGWVWVDRGGFEASNEDWRDMKQLPESERKIKLTLSNDHTAISSTR